MQPIHGSDWQKTKLWKIVSNPAIEVVAAIIVVLFTAILVIWMEADDRKTAFPVPVLDR